MCASSCVVAEYICTSVYMFLWWWRSMFACMCFPELKPSLGTTFSSSFSHMPLLIHKQTFVRSSKEIQNLTHFIISLLGPSPKHAVMDYYSSLQPAPMLSHLLHDNLIGARVIFLNHILKQIMPLPCFQLAGFLPFVK